MKEKEEQKTKRRRRMNGTELKRRTRVITQSQVQTRYKNGLIRYRRNDSFQMSQLKVERDIM